MKKRWGVLGYILTYAALSYLLALFLIVLEMPDQLLVLLMVPPVVASITYGRLIYWPMCAIFLVTAIWVTSHLALFPEESLKTDLVAFLAVAATCEGVSSLAAKMKRAQAVSMKNEARYRELIENADDIIYSHDLSGRLLTMLAGPVLVSLRGLVLGIRP